MSEPLAAGLAYAYRANVWKFFLFQFLLNFQLWWPIWVIYLQEERGLSLGQVTLLDVPFWGCIVLLQVPAAALADRWGRKPTLALGALLWAGAVALFGLATTFPLLLISYFVWAAAWTLLNGPDSAFLYDSLRALGREGEYQRLYGGALAMMAVGGLIGTLAGAPIAAATSLPFPIVLSGGIAALAVLIALTFREPLPEFRSELATSYRAVIDEAARTLARVPEIRYAIFFFGVTTVGMMGPIFFFQPFLVRHGVDIGDVGYWQTPMRIAGILGAMYAYRWMAIFGERRAFFLMPAALVASYALIGAWDSSPAQVAFPVMALVTMAARPAITDYLNRRVSSGQRATVVSLTSLVYSLVLMPIAPALGALFDQASPQAAYWATAAIMATASFPLLALWFRLPQPAPQPVAIEEGQPQSKGLPGVG